jgi:cyclophilin family peptidyl-prolyl cis-trans isomerase
MKKIFLIITFVLVLAGTFFTLKMTGNLISNSEKAIIETNFGEIIIEIYPDKAPITVANFKRYVSEEFYNGTIFHRIIDGFMIQGGGYDSEGNERANYAPIKLESQNGLSNDRGTIAMARTMVPIQQHRNFL